MNAIHSVDRRPDGPDFVHSWRRGRRAHAVAPLAGMLVLALANCRLEAARQRARRWIETQRTFFFKDSDFAAALCAGRYPDIRAFAREGLRLLAIDEATAQAPETDAGRGFFKVPRILG